MRGKAQRAFHGIMTIRITPAYAGKRSGNHADQVGNRDHPRLCGEKPSIRLYPKSSLGSPPPMRGKGKAFLAVGVLWRITPAYAGKSECLYKNLRVT